MKSIVFALICVSCAMSFCKADLLSKILSDEVYAIVGTELKRIENELPSNGDSRQILHKLNERFGDLVVVMDRARDSGDVSSAHPILEDGLDILIELVPTLEQKELRGKFSNIAAYQAKVLHSSSSDNDGLTLNDIDVLFQFVAQTLIDPSEGGKADTISGDKYTELMGLLREQKKFAIPSARGILQGLIGAVQDLKRAKNEKDPDAAKEILKSGSNKLEELLPKLRGGKFYQFYSNTLTKNRHLNQKLAPYYGNSVFDYTDTYIEEITAELGRLLSE